MSRQVRHRVTAVLLGGLLLGAPLLPSEMADAAPKKPAAGQKTHPAQVTATPSELPTPTPAPTRANSSEPSRRSVVPDPGLRPRIIVETPSFHRPGRSAKVKTKIRRGTGSSAPMHAGMPPTAKKKPSARRVPTPGLSSPAKPERAALARPVPGIAAQRVATTAPMPANGQIGLLAAVSMVLVVGVSAGVIRAIVAERASRTKIA